jgi:hypothetical protein
MQMQREVTRKQREVMRMLRDVMRMLRDVMRMLRSPGRRPAGGHTAAWFFAVLLLASSPGAVAAAAPQACRSVAFDGAVKAGQAFEKPISAQWVFLLEPVKSGWFIRVLERGKPRTEHNAAELATPPYHSVTPLSITTDMSFRAQDAIAWNPRRFRYAGSEPAYQKLVQLYPEVMKGNAAASVAVAEVVQAQPEATLTITHAELVPGSADQAGLAATVASHLDTTPHSVAAGPESALGKLVALSFKVEMDLPVGGLPLAGAPSQTIPCSGAQPALPTLHRK